MNRVKSTTMATLALLGLAFGLAACTEKPQSANASARKADEQPWQTAQGPYVAPGWSGGDAAGWEQQMRKRAQGQNEYARIAPVPQ